MYVWQMTCQHVEQLIQIMGPRKQDQPQESLLAMAKGWYVE